MVFRESNSEPRTLALLRFYIKKYAFMPGYRINNGKAQPVTVCPGGSLFKTVKNFSNLLFINACAGIFNKNSVRFFA